MGIVGLGGEDARQAEKRPRRIIAMGADVDADFFGNRRHLGEKVDQILLQPFAVDAVIGAQLFQKLGERITIRRARQTRADIAPERCDFCIRHLSEAFCRFFYQPVRIIGLCVGALQDVNIEGGEIGKIEAHRLRAVFGFPAQVGAGPVQHGHEIVADGADAGGGKAAQRLLPVGYMGFPIAGLGLDILGNRHAFHHVPIKTAGLDGLMPLCDFVDRPDVTGGDVMQRTDNAFRPRLSRILNRDLVDRAEPPPCMSHLKSSNIILRKMSVAPCRPRIGLRPVRMRLSPRQGGNCGK
ncbi:hypothetical protein D3C72_734580 [compost metagenome]